MGYTHYFTAKQKTLSEEDIANIKLLISTAKSEFDVDITERWQSAEDMSYGDPIVTQDTIFFNHPAQESFALDVHDGNFNFIKTQGAAPFAQEADMLTTSILLYLEAKGKIDYNSDGVNYNGDAGTLTIDPDIVDAYNFTEHVLGDATLDDIGALAARMESKYMREEKEYELVIGNASVNYHASPSSKVPGAGITKAGARGSKSGICGFFMPRAQRTCGLGLNHSGGHR